VRTISDLGFRIADLVRESNNGGIDIAPHPAVDPAFSNPQTANRNPHSITLHIDELILHGFAASDRHGISESIERELGRLLEQKNFSPLPADDIDIEQIDGGSFQLQSGSRAAVTGAHIASAVYSAASSAIDPAAYPAAAPVPGGETRP